MLPYCSPAELDDLYLLLGELWHVEELGLDVGLRDLLDRRPTPSQGHSVHHPVLGLRHTVSHLGMIEFEVWT